MPIGKREVIEISERRLITEKELEDAFHASEEEFWAKALTFFPEVKTGDTEPGATGEYSITVKAFMKHWLRMNSHIEVGGLSEHDAINLLEEIVEYETESRPVSGNADQQISIHHKGRAVILTVVELALKGTYQGYGIVGHGDREDGQFVGTDFDEISAFVNRTINKWRDGEK